jgi:hypothetical protein
MILLQLKIIGILMIVLALIHMVFPRYFDWEQELTKISLINKQMMYFHTFFIGLIVLLMGVLSFTAAEELISTSLGKKIALGLFIFWGTRLGIQFFGYSSLLWKGKRFETYVHLLFAVLWTYFSVIFLMVYLG